MKGKNNKYSIFLITIIIGVALSSVFSTITSNYVFGNNPISYLQKISGKPMLIKKELTAKYNHKDYIITLSTPSDKADELYANIFEEVLSGILYKPTYGALPGKSKSLYGMLQVYTENGSDNHFDVVYGYNKDLKAGSYEVQQAKDSEFITNNISQQEYFLKTFEGIVYPVVNFKDQNKKDISDFFINGK